jgi:hypothetical protein
MKISFSKIERKMIREAVKSNYEYDKIEIGDFGITEETLKTWRKILKKLDTKKNRR